MLSYLISRKLTVVMQDDGDVDEERRGNYRRHTHVSLLCYPLSRKGRADVLDQVFRLRAR